MYEVVCPMLLEVSFRLWSFQRLYIPLILMASVLGQLWRQKKEH